MGEKKFYAFLVHDHRISSTQRNERELSVVNIYNTGIRYIDIYKYKYIYI